MSTTLDGPSYWRDRLPRGWRFGALIGGPAAFGDVVLLGNGWAACDVGVNASANFGTLMFFVLPLMWVVNAALFGVVFAAASGDGRRKQMRGLVAAVAAVVFLGWLLFAGPGTPGGSPDPRCPNGVPTWWPSWIPA